MDRAATEGRTSLAQALREVAELGGPAQQELALGLLATMRDHVDATWDEQAALLVNAFRDDPHLWR